MNPILAEIANVLQSSKPKNVTELVKKALDEGISASEILSGGLMAGMDVIAEKFKNNELFVPEVMSAASAMNAATEILKPHMTEGEAKPLGKCILGTVKGDLHDIGKNLVKMMLEGKGIEVIDLGVDVSPEKFVETHKEMKADIVALSALLTTTMPEMKKTVDAFVEAGLRDEVVIMVGGAPITENSRGLAGADLYAPDAASAAELAKQAIAQKLGA